MDRVRSRPIGKQPEESVWLKRSRYRLGVWAWVVPRNNVLGGGPGLFIPSYCEVGFCHVLRETKIWQKHVMRDSLTSPLRLLLTGFECQQTKRKILWKKCQRFFHAMVMIDQT